MVSFLEAVGSALKDEARDYMPRIATLLLCFHHHLQRSGRNKNPTAVFKLASCISALSPNLDTLSPLALQIISSQIDTLDKNDSLSVKSCLLNALLALLTFCDISDSLLVITKLVIRKWDEEVLKDVSETVLDVLKAISGLDHDINMMCWIQSLENKRMWKSSMYDTFEAIVRIENRFASMTISSNFNLPTASFYDLSSEQKSGMNMNAIRRALDTSQCSSKETWFDWLRRLGVDLLRESPNGSLRVCAALAASFYPLNKELFNAAFLSCWNDMIEEEQKEVAGVIEGALSSSTAPAELSQTLLDLAEYMEHLEKALPISISTLGTFAMASHAYAKALYYREDEFKENPSVITLESLVSINSQIQNQDGAIGILNFSQKKFGISLNEAWFEKLQRWEEALAAYQSKLKQNPESTEAFLGNLRCRYSLGDWEELNSEAEERWPLMSQDAKSLVAPLACASCWAVNDFEAMSKFVQVIPETSEDGCFFRAVHAINNQSYSEAIIQISATRRIMDTELTALIGESYSRAYISAIRVQMLSELEEVIEYAQESDLSKRSILKRALTQRLMDCQENVEVWQRLLKVRSLVTPMEEDKDLWIRFAKMARASRRTPLAASILQSLLQSNPPLEKLDVSSVDSHVAYAFIKHHWKIGGSQHAKDALFRLANYLSLKIESRADPPAGLQQLVSKCFVTLGKWQLQLQCSPEHPDDVVLQYYLQATAFDKSWYKAWHAWALANYEAAGLVENSSTTSPLIMVRQFEPPDLRHRANPYVVPAIQGFFRSMAIAPHSALQDALRLLTLWFKFGALPEVSAAIGDGFFTIPVSNWLTVLPQLIARIHVPNTQVRRLIHTVLAEIGRHYPQALIYSLTVAAKSQNVSRRTSATALLDKLRSHSAVLVEEAQMISEELIRVAILWEEMWFEGLEEASRMYFGEQNVPPMLAILEPLHAMLDRGAETIREQQFIKAYGEELREARDLCKRYRKSRNMADVTAAWELYYQAFRRINKSMPTMATIDLEQASPRLCRVHDISLSVPGTFRDDEPIIRIAKVHPRLQVISSKQRPRKLAILGSDGRWHKFLLKGHEDLRQDERVMQFFGLMNTLLASDAETRKRHLDIQRYSIIPLSQNTGLIGWVNHSDTMHSLIKEYREQRGIQLSLEHRLMLQFAPDYDHLTVLQKIETFSYAMGNSDGDDLARIFWLKSESAESWLERRTQFIRSIAVMSMAGYVLGLGDRHPSNLMIDKMTGRVIHIDFGDCFEVAMHREKFPEKVPFRLTRMLIKAFEASGVDGSFRITCEHTMRVMRVNKDSLMAILEAFIYDPLINWRLLSRSTQPRPSYIRPSTASFLSSNTSNFPDDFSLARRLRREEYNRLEEESVNRPDTVHAGALNALTRVGSKLTGRDFRHFHHHQEPVSVSTQVDLLINEATQIDNLCQAYVGWCAFW